MKNKPKKLFKRNMPGMHGSLTGEQASTSRLGTQWEGVAATAHVVINSSLSRAVICPGLALTYTKRHVGKTR